MPVPFLSVSDSVCRTKTAKGIGKEKNPIVHKVGSREHGNAVLVEYILKGEVWWN